MKGYRDYMNSRSVDPILHEKIMRKVTKKPKPLYQNRAVLRNAMAVACMTVLMFGIWLMPGFFGNENTPDGINTNPPGYLQSEHDVGPVPPENGTEVNVLHELVFNNEYGQIIASRIPPDFVYELTGEQFNAIFPTLSQAHFNASVSYWLPREDYFAGLTEVSAYDSRNADEGVHIRLMETGIVDADLFMEEELYISNVYGIRVAAFVHDGHGVSGGEFVRMYFVRAEFSLEGIAYSVSYANTNLEAAKAELTELANQIIAGGAADMSVLADPIVPELRNEELTHGQALLDPDFGALMPVSVPQGFIFDSGRRILNQWENSLRVHWHRFPSVDNIFWTVAQPTEYDLERMVPAGELYKYDVSLYPIPWFDSVPEEIREYFHNPVFLAEEMSLEVVQGRARLEEGRRGESASWSIDSFSVLYGDVIIHISARGVSAEQLWDMIPPR
jgi:hypothetical protein